MRKAEKRALGEARAAKYLEDERLRALEGQKLANKIRHEKIEAKKLAESTKKRRASTSKILRQMAREEAS